MSFCHHFFKGPSLVHFNSFKESRCTLITSVWWYPQNHDVLFCITSVWWCPQNCDVLFCILSVWWYPQYCDVLLCIISVWWSPQNRDVLLIVSAHFSCIPVAILLFYQTPQYFLLQCLICGYNFINKKRAFSVFHLCFTTQPNPTSISLCICFIFSWFWILFYQFLCMVGNFCLY